MKLPRVLAPLALALALGPTPAQAVLEAGDAAPDFTAEAALGGEPFTFSLADALARGPVVLYFYPKAFTTGCTIEAKAFADATPRFRELGATVIGVSSDDIETLKRFSIEACRNEFAVAADEESKIIRAYDAASSLFGNRAARVSYVIDTAGKIAFTHDSINPKGHITSTLEAVERLVR